MQINNKHLQNSAYRLAVFIVRNIKSSKILAFSILLLVATIFVSKKIKF